MKKNDGTFKLFIPRREDYDTPCRWKKRDGEPCLRHALPGSNFCHWHGGGSPFKGKPRMGKAFSLTHSGRRSKFFTQTLAAKYAEAQSDPELYVLRSDLAVLELRLEELLKRAQEREQADRWGTLREKFLELKRAQAEDDRGTVMTISGEIEDILDDTEHDIADWDQILKLLTLRKAIVETEMKRLVLMQQMVSAEDVMKVAAQLLAAVKKHIGKPPEEAYAAIAYEFSLINGEFHPGQPAERGDPPFEPDRSPGMDPEVVLDP